MATKRLLTPLLLLSRPPPRSFFSFRPHLLLPPSTTPTITTIRLSSSSSTTSSTTHPPPPQPAPHTFTTITHLSSHPSPARLLIDVREPAEIAATGKIPSAVTMPITSNPDAVYLSPGDFYDRFGFRRPCSSAAASPSGREKKKRGGKGEEEEEGEEIGPHVAGHGGADVGAEAEVEKGKEGGDGEVEEVVFYCKAGVRSKAAAQMAAGEGGWKGVKIGHWGGGWMEWEKMGGKVER